MNISNFIKKLFLMNSLYLAYSLYICHFLSSKKFSWRFLDSFNDIMENKLIYFLQYSKMRAFLFKFPSSIYPERDASALIR